MRRQKISKQCVIIFALLFFVVSACFFSFRFVVAQANQTESKLQAATTAVNQAFTSVLAAEKAGANVSGLLSQLNDANSLLAQAENANTSGDDNTAVNDANAALPIAQQVTRSAQTAKENALASSQNAFWSTIAITIVTAVVFVLALFLVWRWFKRRYIEGLSKAKPEVTDQ
jgi:CHASE3 domain sensor protein